MTLDTNAKRKLKKYRKKLETVLTQQKEQEAKVTAWNQKTQIDMDALNKKVQEIGRKRMKLEIQIETLESLQGDDEDEVEAKGKKELSEDED